MYIRNVKSFADLDAKKALAKNILDVEIENEVENAKRTEFRRNPSYKAPEGEKIQPQYKTSAELQKDRALQEKEARSNLEALGFDYQKASDMIVWLSSSLINRLVEFNSFFKGIEKELKATTNPKLLSVEYLKNYLERYFDDLDVNYGRKFGAAEPQLVNTLEDLIALFPDMVTIRQRVTMIFDTIRDEITGGIGVLSEEQMNKLGDVLANIMMLLELIEVYNSTKPSQELVEKMSVSLTQNERQKLLKSYSSLLRRYQFLSINEVRELEDLLQAVIDNQPIVGEIPLTSSVIKRLIKSFSELTKGNAIDAFNKVAEQFYSQVEKTDIGQTVKEIIEAQLVKQRAAYAQVNIANNELVARKLVDEALQNHLRTGFNPSRPAVDALAEIERLQALSHPGGGASLAEITRLQNLITAGLATPADINNLDELLRAMKVTPASKTILEAEERKAQALIDRGDVYSQTVINRVADAAARNDSRNPFDPSLRANTEDLLQGILVSSFGYTPAEAQTFNRRQAENIIKQRQREAILANPGYNPAAGDRIRNPIGYPVSRKLPYDKARTPGYSKSKYDKIKPSDPDAALKYEYVGAPFLSTTGDILGFGIRKDLQKHFKEDEKYEAQISKELKKLNKKKKDDSSSDDEVMIGVGFNAKRIDVKKKIGKGITIDKEENPTYRTFGKYVVHVPHLVNNSVANFKYPSLGSIPAIKPLTISSDYKDFLIDVINNGKVNEAAYKHLPIDEVKHFEKVVIGAGLVEKFKLKLGSSDDDKKDLKRFELLRGEYIAGNNAPSMIKELRMLIVKFMNSGRIHKQEGLNLLMELATI